jgi:hypothetical protein
MQQATILYDAASNMDRAKENRFQPGKKEVGIVVKADDGKEYYLNALEGGVLWDMRKGEKCWIDGIKPSADSSKRGSAKFVRKVHESDTAGAPIPAASPNVTAVQVPMQTRQERADELAAIAVTTWNKLSEGLAIEKIKPTSEDIQKLVATVLISLK